MTTFNPMGGKINVNEKKKIEAMLEVIHKATSKESSQHWRKHAPVYGWIQMNYPTSIQPSLVPKYEKQREQLDQVLLEQPTTVQTEDHKDEANDYCPGNKFRLEPERVNEYVLKESKPVITYSGGIDIL
jgi:hypothetical protein